VRDYLPSIIDHKNSLACCLPKFLIGGIVGLLISAGPYEVELLNKVDAAGDNRRDPFIDVQ
jgi:hypothetical protein